MKHKNGKKPLSRDSLEKRPPSSDHTGGEQACPRPEAARTQSKI